MNYLEFVERIWNRVGGDRNEAKNLIVEEASPELEQVMLVLGADVLIGQYLSHIRNKTVVNNVATKEEFKRASVRLKTEYRTQWTKLLNYPLWGGKIMGDAIRPEILISAENRDKLVDHHSKRSAFERLIASRLPDDNTLVRVAVASWTGDIPTPPTDLQPHTA